MQIPSAGFIEIAIDQLAKCEGGALAMAIVDQQKELQEAKGMVTTDFAHGYALGLQTARVILETSSLLAIKGVKAEDVL